MRVYDISRMTGEELLLYDILLELKNISRRLNTLELINTKPSESPEVEPSTRVTCDSIPTPPKVKPCKYCGDLHTNRGVAMNCAKKHKKLEEEVTL